MKKYILSIILFCITFYANAQSALSGYIKNTENSEAIAGAYVHIPELQKTCLSDKNGFYEFKDLPQGHFHVQFSMLGYASLVKHVNIAKEPVSLSITLDVQVIHSQEVVVSAGSYMTQHENAVKVETIRAKELQALNNVSYLQSMASIPGVDIISKGNAVATPVIRGLSLSNLLVLNNGIRLENFQFSENHPFMTDDYGIEKIEIIKGPASLLYGSDAIGGVINMIKEKNAPANTIQGDFNAVYHSNTDGLQGNLGLKTTKGSWAFGLRAGHASHKDYAAGNQMFVPNSRFNNTSAKFNAGLSKNFGKFELFYDYNKMQLGMTIPPAIALVKEQDRKNEYWFQDLNNHLFNLQNTLFINRFKIKLNLAYQMNDRKLHQSVISPEKTKVHMQLNTLLYELKVYLPSIGNSDIIAGFQGTHQNNKNGKTPIHVLPDYTNNNFSVYGLYQQDFLDKIHFQAGLRYDIKYIYAPFQERSLHNDDKQEHNKMQEFKDDYANFSGSIGATFKMNSRLLLRTNFASAYRTPHIAELTQDGMHGNRYEQGDRNMQSQRSYESDLGIHYHDKYISFDLATFYNYINNYIYLSPSADTTHAGGKIFKYVQNNAKLYGIETAFKIRPNSWVLFNANYAFLLAEDIEGNALPFIPQNKIHSNIVFTYEKIRLLNKIQFSSGFTYAFAQNKPSLFETKTDDYFVLNAALAFYIPLFERVFEFRISAHNLLNTAYYDHLSTLKPLGFYNMGRNFSFSLSIPFGAKLGS